MLQHRGFINVPSIVARVVLAQLVGFSLVAARPAEPAAAPSLGLQWSTTGVADPPALPAGASAAPARLVVAWDEVVPREGETDWSRVEEDVERLRKAGYQVALCLTGPAPAWLGSVEPPTPKRPGALEEWLAFARGAVRRFAGRIETFQVWDALPARGVPSAAVGFEPDSYAFVAKSSALAMRAEARRLLAPIRVAQAAVGPDELEWQRQIWDRDMSAYVDVLPLRILAPYDDDALAEDLRALLVESLQQPPASEIWVLAEGGSPLDRAAVAVRALATGASVALVDGGDQPDLLRWVAGTHALLDGGYAPAPQGEVRIEGPSGTRVAGARVLGRFFNGDDATTLIFYSDPGPTEDLPRDRLIVDTELLRNVWLLDPLTGREVRTPSSPLPGPERGRALGAATGPLPMAIRFTKPTGSAGFALPPEAIETRSDREMTAEEIIAGHQQAGKVQDDRLERLLSRGRVEFHFSVGAGGSFNVAIASNYFWERGSDLEWEHTDYYIGGNRVPWKNFPKLPFIQPDKVLTLPLDLTLDRTYAYRKVGAGRVGDREAYVLAFEPLDPDAPSSLYRGRIWIDRETFVLLKASLVQTNLEPPVLSNEEVDLYHPYTGPDGEAYWLMDRVDGQQTWNVAGRTFVVQREVTFEEFRINPSQEEFEAEKQAAYESKHTMMRDTEKGFRYLERGPGGSRELQEKTPTSQLFAAAGALSDSSTSGIQPLAGVNYFNFDLWGSGFQTNVFFAGVIAFLTASKPDLNQRGMDLTADAFLAGLKFDNEVFAGSEEIVEERIRTRGQRLALRLGIPFARFWRASLIASANFNEYFRQDDGRAAIDEYNAANSPTIEFVLPQDHVELGGEFQFSFDRRGYSARGSFELRSRSDWESWGMVDLESGSAVSFDPDSGLYVPSEPIPVNQHYRRWGLLLNKQWFLPKFQQVRAGLNYVDGDDLDRFSRYSFSMFGGLSLGGFSGSGVRFDEGLIANAGYSFNVANTVQLGADVATARVLREGFSSERENFTGIELDLNFPIPWKTLVSLEYGYALQSDIPDLEGNQTFLLFFLRLF